MGFGSPGQNKLPLYDDIAHLLALRWNPKKRAAFFHRHRPLPFGAHGGLDQNHGQQPKTCSNRASQSHSNAMGNGSHGCIVT